MDGVNTPSTETTDDGAEPVAPIGLEPTQTLMAAPVGAAASEELAVDRASSPVTLPDAAAVPVEVDPVGACLEQLLTEGVERIMCVLNEKHARDCFREAQVDRLHEELQQYKTDLIGKAVRPVLQSLIRLHDDMGKVLEALAAEDQTLLTPDRLIKVLDGFREDVELALDRNGVTTFRTNTEQFDAIRQRVLRTVGTASHSEVGLIAARLRPGFEQGEQLLEKERVAVFALTPAKPI